ncbi:TPA: DUF551 domain-containing protein [Salmonella enterica subsp. enterica]
MTTITREWLQQTISEFENTRDDIPFGLDDDDAKILKVLKLALASMDARPVAWMCEDEEGREYNSSNEFSCGRFGVPLYAAPPAPVVPEKLPCSVELKPGLIIGKGCKTETLLTALRRRADYYAKIDAFTPEERAEHDASIEAFKAMLPTPADSQGRPRAPVVPPAIEPDYKVIKSILPTATPDEYACCIAADMWNACCATTLQGAEPVSQTYKLPELIEGMEVSIDVSTCDADAGNRYFGTVTEVSELDTAKNGYILLVQDAKPNFDVNGNSPVIPDGWISCSERMPDNDEYKPIAIFTGKCLGQGMFVATYDDDGFFDYWEGMEIIGVSHWMPLPEPPQQ